MKFKPTGMEKNEVNQKQNHEQGSSSCGGKKESKKKSHNSALCRGTNSNLAMKTCKARGRKTFRRKLKTLVENMEARFAEIGREREETVEIAAAFEEMKLELDLLKISVTQRFDGMLRTSEAVDKLAEIIVQLN